jgi:hypothetical protein
MSKGMLLPAAVGAATAVAVMKNPRQASRLARAGAQKGLDAGARVLSGAVSARSRTVRARPASADERARRERARKERREKLKAA